jgi:two-component system response regulator AtoC
MDRRTVPGTSSGTIADSAQSWPWVSPAMRELEYDLAYAIQSDDRVMITGEIGAGRKFVGQLIHERSRRGPAPFVIARCPDEVEVHFESRLQDGASAANNGTLLLEELETITVPMQSRLMRFLEDQVADGSNVRLVTATSTAFFERVRSSQFREDLFYRLNVIHLTVPPLRERPEDILILMRHYLTFYRQTRVPRLSIASWRRLLAHPWPGNVSELKAVAEKLAAQDLWRLVEPEDLPLDIAG